MVIAPVQNDNCTCLHKTPKMCSVDSSIWETRSGSGGLCSLSPTLVGGWTHISAPLFPSQLHERVYGPHLWHVWGNWSFHQAPCNRWNAIVPSKLWMKPWVSGYKLKWLKGVTWGFLLLQGKADTFVPGGASLHNCMTPHGVDTATYEVLLSHNIVKLCFSLLASVASHCASSLITLVGAFLHSYGTCLVVVCF